MEVAQQMRAMAVPLQGSAVAMGFLTVCIRAIRR